MKVSRKLMLVAAVAAVALISSAIDVGVAQTVRTDSTMQARLDDLTARVTYSIAQWQPASGYVPVDYPADGSWERMLSMAGH